jgi:hypothetical protein
MPPFAAMTPVIVTHRFFGRSIADLVMDIQRIKTALLRSILDNAYLAVNPRVEVSEAHATETTLDDLLVSRPGGIVRTKMPGGVNWQTVPAIASEIFPVLEYADATREWRTGVNRQAQGLDANALQNTSATAAMQVYNAAQARMKLIARIFAETGIRDLFSLLHAVIRRNGAQAATVRLRNQWVTVDPRDWKERNDLTINVGLGTGGKSERLAHVMAVINLQKEALAGGLTNLVSVQNLYNSAAEVVKLVDLKNVDQFFTDPKDAKPAAAAARSQADADPIPGAARCPTGAGPARHAGPQGAARRCAGAAAFRARPSDGAAAARAGAARPAVPAHTPGHRGRDYGGGRRWRGHRGDRGRCSQQQPRPAGRPSDQPDAANERAHSHPWTPRLGPRVPRLPAHPHPA